MPTLVALSDVKAHLRKLTTDEDAIIGTYRSAAIAWVENYTGHILSEREVTDTYAAWGDFLELRHQPIRVGDPTPTLVVEYHDVEGDLTEYESRVIRDQLYPWKIVPPYGDAFPVLGDNGTIIVTYTAGYPAGEVPAPLNQATLLLAAHYYHYRGAVQDGDLAEAPLAVTSLCRRYRGVVVA